MKAYHWVIPIMGIAMFCFGSLWLMSGSANFIPALIFFVAAVIPFYLLLWCLPVRCKSPGCNGPMKWTMTQVSDWAPVVKSKLAYQCRVCNDLYETCFYHVPLSGGDPYYY